MSENNTDLAPVEDNLDKVLALPTVRDATGADKEKQFVKIPWLTFFGAKTSSGRDQIKEAGIKQDSFYLRDIVAVKIDPARITLLNAYFCFVKWDSADNKAVAASGVKVKGEADCEHAVGIAVVKLEEGYTVALYEQNRGLADPFFKLQNVVRSVEKDKGGVQWGSKGRHFKEGYAAAGQYPKLAVSGLITGTSEKSQDGKTVFYKGAFSPVANTADEVKAILEYLRSDDGKSRLSAAAATFARKVNALESLIKGEEGAEGEVVADAEVN